MVGLIIAFKNYKAPLGIFGSPWNGLKKNFEFFFTSQDAFRISRNTVGYALLFIAANLITAVIVALLLNEVRSEGPLKYIRLQCYYQGSYPGLSLASYLIRY